MSEEWNWLSSDADLQLWHLLIPIKHTLQQVLQVKLTAKLEGQSIMLGKSNASTMCLYFKLFSCSLFFIEFFFLVSFCSDPRLHASQRRLPDGTPMTQQRPLLLVMESCHRQISFSSSSTWAKEITMTFFRSSLEWNLMKTTYNTQQHHRDSKNVQPPLPPCAPPPKKPLYYIF